ncbi:MAG: hypothetical protein RL490_843, partial [Pseudomonadota bacterium]
IPAACAYRARYCATSQSVNLIVPAGRLEAALDPDLNGRLEPALLSADDGVATLLRIVFAEIEKPGFSSDLLIDGVMCAIAASLARQTGTPAHDHAGRVWLSPAKLRRVLDYIEDHLGEPIMLADLAGVAGLSAFHFTRVFKRATGESPYRFLTLRRLARARHLLAGSALSIAEISKNCGFADQSHFTRAFGQMMTVSPARFRRGISG